MMVAKMTNIIIVWVFVNYILVVPLRLTLQAFFLLLVQEEQMCTCSRLKVLTCGLLPSRDNYST